LSGPVPPERPPPAQLAKQYSKKRCYNHWYIGQTFATFRYHLVTTVHWYKYWPLSISHCR